MATSFKTTDSKVAYECRKALRAGEDITVTIAMRGGTKKITGRVLDVALIPNTVELTWEIVIVEGKRDK